MARGVRVALRWHGTREFWRALDRADHAIRKRVATATAFTAQEVAGTARSLVPVRTGELRSTIRETPTASPFVWMVTAGLGRLRRRRRGTATKRRRARVAVVVEAPGAYAAIVEFGAHGRARQPAQPFLFPALNASYSRHLARLARAWQDGARIAASTARHV